MKICSKMSREAIIVRTTVLPVVVASKQFLYAAMANGVNKTFTPSERGAFELKLVTMEVESCVKHRELYMAD